MMAMMDGKLWMQSSIFSAIGESLGGKAGQRGNRHAGKRAKPAPKPQQKPADEASVAKAATAVVDRSKFQMRALMSSLDKVSFRQPDGTAGPTR